MQISSLPLFVALLASVLACQKEKDARTQPSPQLPAVTGGPRGHVTGHLTRAAGPAPKTTLPTSESVQRVCGAEIPDTSVQTDEAGGLEGGVVWVESAPEPGPERVLPSATLDQSRCQFVPRVLAGRTGSHLTLVNSDALVHNVDAVAGSRPHFNFAMPLTGMRVTRVLPSRPGVLSLRCDFHPWMRAQVRLFDHPHFALTDTHGRFELLDVPAGAQQLHVWHPVLGEQQASVAIAAEKETVWDVALGVEQSTPGASPGSPRAHAP